MSDRSRQYHYRCCWWWCCYSIPRHGVPPYHRCSSVHDPWDNRESATKSEDDGGDILARHQNYEIDIFLLMHRRTLLLMSSSSLPPRPRPLMRMALLAQCIEGGRALVDNWMPPSWGAGVVWSLCPCCGCDGLWGWCVLLLLGWRRRHRRSIK